MPKIREKGGEKMTTQLALFEEAGTVGEVDEPTQVRVGSRVAQINLSKGRREALKTLTGLRERMSISVAMAEPVATSGLTASSWDGYGWNTPLISTPQLRGRVITPPAS